MKSIDLLAGVVRSPKARQSARPSFNPSSARGRATWLAFSPRTPLCISPVSTRRTLECARGREPGTARGRGRSTRISTGWQSCGAIFAGQVRVVVTVVRACERGMQRGRRIMAWRRLRPSWACARFILPDGEKKVRMTP
jgi:hypothetical protein